MRCGVSFTNSEYDAAQALLDLQGNFQGPIHKNSDRNKTIKPAKFNCKCFITSNVSKQPIAASPLHAAGKNSSRKSDVATSHLTVTAGSFSAGKCHAPKKYLLHRYNVNTANNRDVATQTDIESSLIMGMELSISKRDKTIKELREQIKAYEDVTGTVGEVHDESNKEDSREMRMEDSESSYTDTDETSVTDHTYATKNVNIKADDMVPIGNGNTMIPTKVFQNINWDSHTMATRKLLSTVFTRRVLATHSLTGRPSPAFPNKAVKKQLNQTLVNDIVETVAQRCGVPENLVRTCITIKCADENKMLRNRVNNKKQSRKLKLTTTAVRRPVRACVRNRKNILNTNNK